MGRENSSFLPQYAPCRPLAAAPPGAPHIGAGAHASHPAFPPRALIRYSLGPERASFPFAQPNPTDLDKMPVSKRPSHTLLYSQAGHSVTIAGVRVNGTRSKRALNPRGPCAGPWGLRHLLLGGF